MNNFGIGSKHDYTRLLSDSSINTTASDISHTSVLPDKFIGAKNSAASNYELCPALNKIESSNGVFRANGVNGEWLGALQGIIAEKTTIQSFEMGLAITESQSAPIKFQYCTYRVGVDKTLDMRFTPKNEKEFTIQTVGNLWKEEAGPFGLIYKVCEKTAPENCKFTIRE